MAILVINFMVILVFDIGHFGLKLFLDSHGRDLAKLFHKSRFFINMFQHYHFVTAGLSDLYADDRVRFPYFDGLSGFGIELTMKVIKTDEAIPQWPVALLQRLARYIFGKRKTLYLWFLTLIRESWKKSKTWEHHRACFSEKKSRAQRCVICICFFALEFF